MEPQMVPPEQLEHENLWYVVLPSEAHCTQVNGDWRSYPHLQGAKEWRARMRKNVGKLSEFLENQGIYLQCPFPGCNMQGAYVDHITSTNGSHYKALYQTNIPLLDGVPVDELKERAWEQMNIRGGCVMFNHLDWEVRMWRGVPPPPPPRLGQAPVQALTDIPFTARSNFSDHSTLTLATLPSRSPTCPACTSGVIRLADLEYEDEWVRLQEPASVPTDDHGGWQSIPHIAGGKKYWSKCMKDLACKLGRILEAHRVPEPDCKLCPTGRGWHEHIPGPIHYGKINDILGERRHVEVREDMWQEWRVVQDGVTGCVKFNHLDGEVLMFRVGAGGTIPPHVSTPSIPPSLCDAELLRRLQGASPPSLCNASVGSTAMAPPPSNPPGQRLSPPQASSSSAPTSTKSCSFAKFMWRQRVPEIAARLKRHISLVQVDELVCAACKNITVQSIDDHLRSDSHIDNVNQTMSLMSSNQLDELQGEKGLRVQLIKGYIGQVWFNHITGESGISQTTDGWVDRQYEWEYYDYQDQGGYWFNQDTRCYFKVEGNRGHDMGVWSTQSE